VIAPIPAADAPDAATGGFPNIQAPSSQVDDLLDAWQDKRQKV